MGTGFSRVAPLFMSGHEKMVVAPGYHGLSWNFCPLRELGQVQSGAQFSQSAILQVGSGWDKRNLIHLTVPARNGASACVLGVGVGSGVGEVG